MTAAGACSAWLALLTVAVSGGTAAIAAQSTADVASVKRNTSGSIERSVALRPGGTLVVNNFPVRPLVLMAHRIQPQQLIGGPDWILSDHYDIVARAASPVQSVELFVGTLRSVLAERFKMKTHVERRELPVYMLVPSRADRQPGPRLTRVPTGCGAPQGDAPAPPPCNMNNPPGRVTSKGATIDMLAFAIGSRFDRVLIDRTGFAGWYDVELEYAAELTAAESGGAAPIMTALQEQLGMRVEPGRAAVDVVVIDAIERPTEN